MHLNDLEGVSRTRVRDSERKIERRALLREARASLDREPRPSFLQRFRRGGEAAAPAPKPVAPTFKKARSPR
jgi:hypothetical protein